MKFNKINTSWSVSMTGKIIMNLMLILIIFNFSATGCKKDDFDPPNKANITTGNAEKVVPVGTALSMKKFSDIMAKAWDPEAVLMEVNGINIGIDGFNQTNLSSSQWILTYLAPKREVMKNTYTITFDGKGRTTWLENGGNYLVNNNIGNFAVDSDKALLNADKAGLPQGKIYTIELRKNDKGMVWVIGSKLDEGSSKYEIRKIDALSGEEVK
jgi:hypothetical protein